MGFLTSLKFSHYSKVVTVSVYFDYHVMHISSDLTHIERINLVVFLLFFFPHTKWVDRPLARSIPNRHTTPITLSRSILCKNWYRLDLSSEPKVSNEHHMTPLSLVHMVLFTNKLTMFTIERVVNTIQTMASRITSDNYCHQWRKWQLWPHVPTNVSQDPEEMATPPKPW